MCVCLYVTTVYTKLISWNINRSLVWVCWVLPMATSTVQYCAVHYIAVLYPEQHFAQQKLFMRL